MSAVLKLSGLLVSFELQHSTDATLAITQLRRKSLGKRADEIALSLFIRYFIYFVNKSQAVHCTLCTRARS